MTSQLMGNLLWKLIVLEVGKLVLIMMVMKMRCNNELCWKGDSWMVIMYDVTYSLFSTWIVGVLETMESLH